MKRRDFLTTAAAGATGYSMFIKVDALADPQDKRSAEEIRQEMQRLAPTGNLAAAPFERNMKLVELNCDVLVAGGGLAGVLAAVSAARHGAKVVLVQDRSRLGGNSSSEIKMHVVGANNHKGRPGWREGGLLEEFRLDDAANNPQRCWELWDLLLYDKVVSEPNITLLLETTLYNAEVKDGLIQRVQARCDRTEHIYRITSKLFADCTGDSRLGVEAGAEYRVGHEARAQHGESLAPETADNKTQGCSILFTSRDFGKPMPFTPPKWARKITEKDLKARGINSWEYGYWWIEWGGHINTIRDNERIRFELLGIVMGVWGYIKNSGKYPSAASWAMDWVGMLPGKREARRLVGDHMLTQMDLMGLNGEFEDAVCIGGWNLDEHPPTGFENPELPPFVSIKLPGVYNIPFRSLYSKNVRNLLMAGRNISATHTAFSSTRVMGTCAVEGQAVGTAAALCVKHGLLPRGLYEDKAKLKAYQQTLLRDDQSIKGVKNEDPLDLARTAAVTASGEDANCQAANVLNGWTRILPGYDNQWAASLGENGAWLELAWDKPQTIKQLQLIFDSGFIRELTLSSSAEANKGIIRAPQPETVKRYSVQYQSDDGKEWTELVSVKGNHQRLRRHQFAPVAAKRMRIHVNETNGDKLARIFEVRCYA
ncbi:MAG: FAD-dependent oxidoreductase [Acidobacteria bacterium]|nr:FAD-dependent oxidoreductase [Acidobacteriota bacterium]MBI3422039.1 FAD-dependent oxidoreductase [Acidobacteriota bacterium]